MLRYNYKKDSTYIYKFYSTALLTLNIVIIIFYAACDLGSSLECDPNAVCDEFVDVFVEDDGANKAIKDIYNRDTNVKKIKITIIEVSDGDMKYYNSQQSTICKLFEASGEVENLNKIASDKLEVCTVDVQEKFFFLLLPRLLLFHNKGPVLFIFEEKKEGIGKLKKELEQILMNHDSIKNMFFYEDNYKNEDNKNLIIGKPYSYEKIFSQLKTAMSLPEIILQVLSTYFNESSEDIKEIIQAISNKYKIKHKIVDIDTLVKEGYKFALVVGQCGVGKSTLVKTMLGLDENEITTGDDNVGVTRNMNIYTHKDPNLKLALIDTPGLENLDMYQQTGYTQDRKPYAQYIVETVEQYLKKGLKINAILYCIKAKDSDKIKDTIKYENEAFTITGKDPISLFGYNHGRGVKEGDENRDLKLYDNIDIEFLKKNHEVIFLEKLCATVKTASSQSGQSPKFIFCCLQSKTIDNGLNNIKFLLSLLGIERKWYLQINDFFDNNLINGKLSENKDLKKKISSIVGKQYGYDKTMLDRKNGDENAVIEFVLDEADKTIRDVANKTNNNDNYKFLSDFSDKYLNVNEIEVVPINIIGNVHEEKFGVDLLENMIYGNVVDNDALYQKCLSMFKEVKYILSSIFLHSIIEEVLNFLFIPENNNVLVNTILQYITKSLYIYSYSGVVGLNMQYRKTNNINIVGVYNFGGLSQLSVFWKTHHNALAHVRIVSKMAYYIGDKNVINSNDNDNDNAPVVGLYIKRS